MPIITYEIQRDVCKILRGKKYWRCIKELIEIEVSDKVAAFLKRSDKSEKRYQDKIRKQIKAANIIELFSLNDKGKDILGDSLEYEFEEITEDAVHPDNRNPLAILLEQEDVEILKHFYSIAMTKKQYETFKLHEVGYNKTEIAKLLNIDESSARERLESALICAVEFSVVHSNVGILLGLHDFIFKELQGKISKTDYSKAVGATFRALIYLIRPDHRKFISYLLNGGHKKEIKKYLDSSEQTPEKPS